MTKRIKQLTAKQREYVEAIRAMQAEGQVVSPNGLALRLGKSPSPVIQMLMKLRAAGVIRRGRAKPGFVKAIELVGTKGGNELRDDAGGTLKTTSKGSEPCEPLDEERTPTDAQKG